MLRPQVVQTRLLYQLLRCYASSATTRIFPSINKPTSARIAVFCKEEGLPQSNFELNPPNQFPAARLHSIDVGASEAAGVLLYFHGGGYTHPISMGHLRLSNLLSKVMRCNELCLLEYTLLPEGTYPTQLAQATEALRSLLKTYEPQQIAIAGDSAGANLVLSLLAHLKTPHPQVPHVSVPSKLASSICISPRCSNHTSAPSFTYNAQKDYIDANAVKAFITAWQPRNDEVWAAANNGGKVFWADRNAIWAERMLVIAGEHECYIDDIRIFADFVSSTEAESMGVDTGMQFFIAKGAMHAQTILDLAVGKEQGSMTSGLLEWATRNPVAARRSK